MSPGELKKDFKELHKIPKLSKFGDVFCKNLKKEVSVKLDKVKSKLLRIFTVIASMFLVIAPAFMSNNTDAIEAADVTSSLVDSITTNIGYAKPGQKVTFHLHFSGKTDYPVKAGDTIHVNFPQASSTGAGIQGIPHEQPLIYHNPDNPNDPDNGVDMGTVTVTKTGVTITFNQKAAGLKTIEGGDFSFTGVVTKQQGTNPTQVNPWPDGGNLPTPEIGVGQNIPPATPGKGIGTPNIVMPTGQIKKSGNIGNDGNVQWQIHGVIGNPGTTTITDQAQDGQTIVPGTFKITFFGQLANSEWMSTNLQYGDDGKLPAVSEIGSLNESSNGFTLDINDANVISELEDIAQLDGDSSGLTNGNLKKVAYTITYETKLASNETHTQWTNSAVQKNPDGSSTNTANGVVANTWSNDIWGTQPKDGVIFDKQTTDGEGLPGATFQLTGNGQNQTAVSNGAGIVKFTGLTNGDTYTVKEIKAPAGYKINNETITVKIVDNKPQITINGKQTNQNVIVDKSTQSSSSSMSSKKSSSSSKKSSAKSSSKKASSKKSSMIKSSSKKASSKKASSKKSSSIKSSVKSSSKKASSKKSSMIKSSSKKASSKKTSSKESSKKSSMIKSSSKKASSKKASSKKSSIKSSVKSSSKESSKKSSMVKSSSKKASSKKASSKESSSIKSSVKSSSKKASSKKSSMIKSSSKKASSKKTSSKESSSIKSSAKSATSKKHRGGIAKSSLVKSSSKTSSKKSSVVASSKKALSKKSSAVASSKVSSKKASSKSVAKNTEKSSSMKNNTIASSKSATKNTEKSSSMKNNTIASSKSVAKNTEKSSSVASSMSSEKNNTTVASSSSVESLSSSNTENTESSSTMNTASESTSKPGKNTETSVKVPSKASTISYVHKSTEKSVPVTVSSTKNTMVESSISSEVRNGSGSASTAYKPTLVSSSMNVPATSWSNEIVNGSSATTVGTTVITYSQSEIPNKAKTNNTMTNANKPVNNVTNNNITNNNHNVNKGGVTVVGNNNNNGNGNGNSNVQGGQTNQGGQGAQGNKSGKGNGNGHGEGLPQTGEAAASAIVGLGIALIAISGVVVLEKKKN